MKNLRFYLLLPSMLMFTTAPFAEISFGLHVGTPPLCSPEGHAYARYYYLPDIESYYDINTSMFIYNPDGRWVHSRELPQPCAHYDLDHGYKVVKENYRGSTPYRMFDSDRRHFKKGYQGPPQRTFRESRGESHSNEYQDEKSDEHKRPSQRGHDQRN